jgi:hypothetical protein
MCTNNFSKCFGNEILKISLSVFWVWICGYVGLPWVFMVFWQPGPGGGRASLSVFISTGHTLKKDFIYIGSGYVGLLWISMTFLRVGLGGGEF